MGYFKLIMSLTDKWKEASLKKGLVCQSLQRWWVLQFAGCRYTTGDWERISGTDTITRWNSWDFYVLKILGQNGNVLWKLMNQALKSNAAIKKMRVQPRQTCWNNLDGTFCPPKLEAALGSLTFLCSLCHFSCQCPRVTLGGIWLPGSQALTATKDLVVAFRKSGGVGQHL